MINLIFIFFLFNTTDNFFMDLNNSINLSFNYYSNNNSNNNSKFNNSNYYINNKFFKLI